MCFTFSLTNLPNIFADLGSEQHVTHNDPSQFFGSTLMDSDNTESSTYFQGNPFLTEHSGYPLNQPFMSTSGGNDAFNMQYSFSFPDQRSQTTSYSHTNG